MGGTAAQNFRARAGNKAVGCAQARPMAAGVSTRAGEACGAGHAGDDAVERGCRAARWRASPSPCAHACAEVAARATKARRGQCVQGPPAPGAAARHAQQAPLLRSRPRCARTRVSSLLRERAPAGRREAGRAGKESEPSPCQVQGDATHGAAVGQKTWGGNFWRRRRTGAMIDGSERGVATAAGRGQHTRSERPSSVLRSPCRGVSSTTHTCTHSTPARAHAHCGAASATRRQDPELARGGACVATIHDGAAREHAIERVRLITPRPSRRA